MRNSTAQSSDTAGLSAGFFLAASFSPILHHFGIMFASFCRSVKIVCCRLTEKWNKNSKFTIRTGRYRLLMRSYELL
jgi:hypothetical protein